jgi:hypothetical protein
MMHSAARNLLFLSCLVASMVTVAGCPGRELRGRVEKSVDGGTYLAIDDDNGGKCGLMLVDGQVWPYAIHSPGPIAPGEHEIECGSGAGIIIKKGTTFHFDYWGP